MKLLFLDVDGVLNHSTCDWTTTNLVLDPRCVTRLQQIVTATGCQVVLSSTWRLHPEARAVLVQAIAPVALLRDTPVIMEKLHREAPRREEIQAVLEVLKPESWAVLDDDTDADLDDGSYFQTYFNDGGLTGLIAAGVTAYLNLESIRRVS